MMKQFVVFTLFNLYFITFPRQVFVNIFLCVVIKGLKNVNDVWRASIVPPFDI